MTSEEFWKDDPQLFVSYRTSFINKKKREKDEQDYICWLQGLYIHHGNGLIIGSLKQLLANMFSKNKDNKDLGTYPTKPYTELEKEETRKNQIQILIFLQPSADNLLRIWIVKSIIIQAESSGLLPVYQLCYFSLLTSYLTGVASVLEINEANF